MSTAVPAVIGVAGAGTMGRGIAQLAALAGARTVLYDPDELALDAGSVGAVAGLARGGERGRWPAADAEAAAARLEPVGSPADLRECGLVIEAAPESLELKRALFAQLAEHVASECVLATNTSSLPVSALAAGLEQPERVVGMHFFNPPTRMRLVEVVAGAVSSERALAVARATVAAMGREAIDALDGPGFLVNRLNRPFSLEAQRLLTERVAAVEQIDRIVRMGGGFPMGPFELMDLIGIDVGLDVARSLWEQSFGEPRWRPSPLAARLVAAGHLGRKTGRGWHDPAGPPSEPDPEPPIPGAAGAGIEDGALIVIAGDTMLAVELGDAAAGAGWEVEDIESWNGDLPWLAVDCRLGEDDGPPLEGAPQAILCAAGSLAALDPGGAHAGFMTLPPLTSGALVELTRGAHTSATAAERCEHFFASLGRHVEWVDDAPGLVLGRIVAQLVNEAAFALGEGLGSADDIDRGLELGMGHPRGPLAWADAIGLDVVLAILDALAEERREERYRAAPLLRRRVLEGRLGEAVGAGFRVDD